MTEYQIIGDIHGKFDRLDGLLRKLGWTGGGTTWSPPADTKIIFVGDYIDRGDQQLAVLETVRSLVDAGDAIALMGNHEFNAVCFDTEDPKAPGEYLRKHSEANTSQHGAFLAQVTEPERRAWIAWFKELPLWHVVGDDELRVVHACWYGPSIDALEARLGGRSFGDRPALWCDAADKRTDLGMAIEDVLKGPEIDITKDPYRFPRFQTEPGPNQKSRSGARFCWWDSDPADLADAVDLSPDTVVADTDTAYPSLEGVAVIPGDREKTYTDDVLVVYGHHWRNTTHWRPGELLPHGGHTEHTACVDFSAGKGGPLVAYRWNGERTIDRSHYIPFGHS